MKTIIKKFGVVGWLLLVSFYSHAFPPDCGENCFRSEIVSQNSTEDGCLTYEMRVFLTGDCAHALSHYTVEIPQCATISNVSNSEGWLQEVASTDPTSGLYGFKIDDIQGFGEDDSNLESFTVSFTVCPEESCETDFSCWSPKVSYKAATCVFYEETEISCVQLAAHVETTDESCFGAADGSAQVIIDEGTEPFTYSWSNGATTSEINGLSAGTYQLTVADAEGNTLDLEAIINSPDQIVLEAAIVNASCAGSADGSVDLFVSGGSGEFTYSWSTGANRQDLNGIAAGSYIVTVTDTNGCSSTDRFTVTNDINISITAEVTKSACAENSGAIDVTVSGGTTPYSFAWDNGVTTEDLSGLAPDVYRLTVTDANGCTGNKTFVVQQDNPISISATTTQTACIEDNSGAIDITVTGGAEPYSYSWSNGATTEDLSGLAAGMYTVEVTDDNGCSSRLRAVVSGKSFDVAAQVTDVSCFGGADGAIAITPSGGESPYTYSWSNGESGSSISGLEATLYRVTVTDARGCEKSLSYFVNDPAELIATATVSNPNCETSGNDVDLNVSGGTPDYNYNWSNGTTSEDLTDVEEGKYSVTVTDANGCTTSLTVVADTTVTGCDDGSGDGDTGDGDDGTGDGDDGSGDGDSGNGDDGSGDDGSDAGGDDSDNDDGSGGDESDNDDGSGGDDSDDGDDSDEDGSDDDDSDNDNDDRCNNPFNTEIELIEVDGDCYTYRFNVSYDGNHSFGLSHLSFGVECGTISDVNNEFNWPIEIGTDPTTGITGFKIDDISGFGEGDYSEGFDGTFTICSTDENCAIGLQAADFEVSYKYGQCVDYQQVDGTTNATSMISTYPNPFREQATIEFTSPVDTEARVELYNQQGHKVMTLFNGFLEAWERKKVQFNASDLVNDMYTYRVVIGQNIYYGKLVKY